jgi:hypothetical protein
MEISMSIDPIVQYAATICFALAILHTFSVSYFRKVSHRFPEGSVGENFFHLLGEVEVVFGVWAGIFIFFFMLASGFSQTNTYLNERNFTEPIFVFVIMVICSTRPILLLSENIIRLVGRALPIDRNIGFFISTLVIGPILGSFITEPAAMTVTALILLNNFYNKNISDKLKYATIGLLFVNVSIGGTLTPYAAPPVLMVAPVWNWDLMFMMKNFGWKSIVAIVTSTLLIAFRFRSELKSIEPVKVQNSNLMRIPYWITTIHLLVLAGIVMVSHYMILFSGLFLFFLGIVSVTKEYQFELKIKESLLVGFFLGGLVILGGVQSWWLSPILSNLNTLPLYLGSMGLTAFTDNAAITYLGSQVTGLSDLSKYALVAGSVVGGGLTVIANAPNPAGYSTLNESFGSNGIKPLHLFLNALIPTIIAALCFWFL